MKTTTRLVDWLLLRPFWVPVFTGRRRVVMTFSEEGRSEKKIRVQYWTNSDWKKVTSRHPVGEKA